MQKGKEGDETCNSTNLERTKWLQKKVIFLTGPSKCWADKNTLTIIYPDLLSSIVPVLHYSELLVPFLLGEISDLLKRAIHPKKFKSSIQITEVQLKKETSTLPTKNDLNNLIKVHCWTFDIKSPAIEFVTWRCASHKSVKAEPVYFKCFHQCFLQFSLHFASATIWMICQEPVELIVIPASGASSLITYPRSSKTCHFTKGIWTHIWTHLLPWLIQCSWNRDGAACISRLKHWNMKNTVGKLLKTLSDLLMGIQWNFTKFPCYLCLWKSKETSEHYWRRDWAQWTEFSEGKKSIRRDPLLGSGK